MADQRTIKEGDHVIFKTDDKTKVFQVFRNRLIFFEKNKLKGEQLIGQHYGTLFECRQGNLMTIASDLKTSAVLITAEGSGKDNRDLVASTENQKLSQDDILRMKDKGLSGKDIVEKLVEESETFKTKTEFSQEKYIKKKKKKHMLVFRVLCTNSSLLLDIYRLTPAKICCAIFCVSNLRADSVSQLLCYSNLMAGLTVAVVESCHGLILGAVMERMGGSGHVLHLYPGNDMNRHVVKNFNFSENHEKMLLDFPLNKLALLEAGSFLTEKSQSQNHSLPVADTGLQGADICSAENMADTGLQSADICSAENVADTGLQSGAGEVEDVVKDTEPAIDDNENSSAPGRAKTKRRLESGDQNQAEKEARKQDRLEKIQEAGKILQERNLDSLIIATKYDPVSLLLRLLPYVAPSRPVVVFSQHKEPLVECFAKVKESGSGIQLKLCESWYREYQVLPSRTHPLVNMSGTGGYLLSFIRVSSANSC